MESKKWYGLTIPKKTAKVNTKGKSVFDSDDSDDNKEVHVKIKKEPSSTMKEKKKKAPEPKPDEIDSNIYEYDSIYDEMKASQKQKTSHFKSKEPRYINLLLKAADKRKKESERRVERKIQAERVKEGDSFKDKEAFVTSAYRQKMIEMEEEEERERRENVLEEMMDSTKQKDLSGFYRHFLKQTVGEEKVPEFGERDQKVSTTAKKQDFTQTDRSRQRSESPTETTVSKKHSSDDNKDAHNDMKRGQGKSQRSDSSHISESRHSSHIEPGHSKDRTSPHKSKSGHRANSSSDSEGRRRKHSPEKSYKKKSDHSANSSKPVHSEKSKNSHSSRNEEEKMQDRDKSHHPKTSMKHASAEKHGRSQSPSESPEPDIQKPKYDKEKKEHKKDTKTRIKTEKGLLQISARASDDDKNYEIDKKSSSNKNKVSETKKSSISPSRKRENKNNDEYPEKKRRRSDNDGERSSTGSAEAEMNVGNKGTEEIKEVLEKPKTDMATKFAKRTVGKIFDDAQARYFRRREAAKAAG